MKVVINKCFGGFGISDLAIQRLAELNGKTAFFFKQQGYNDPYVPADIEKDMGYLSAFDIPNPNDFKPTDLWDNHYLTQRPEDRTDQKLIQVVEELGKKADGFCARLSIVEIPDGICWEIDEYDGQESISEVHRSWG